MKKVLLNEDIVNDSYHIYISVKKDMFQLFEFEISENSFIRDIQRAVDEIRDRGYEINVIIIPFIPYNNWDYKKKSFITESISDHIPYPIIISVPRELKHNVKTYNKE